MPAIMKKEPIRDAKNARKRTKDTKMRAEIYNIFGTINCPQLCLYRGHPNPLEERVLVP